MSRTRNSFVANKAEVVDISKKLKLFLFFGGSGKLSPSPSRSGWNGTKTHSVPSVASYQRRDVSFFFFFITNEPSLDLDPA